MPIGVVELRDIRDGNRTVKKPFISGTGFEITSGVLRKSGWGALSFAEVGKNLDIEYEVEADKVADVRRYAPATVGVRRLLDSHDCDHPGLLLDKFIYLSADQSFVRHALQKVVEVTNAAASDASWFLGLRTRWVKTINREGQLGNPFWFWCTTTGPLTLHLSRASALENAGICLHPLYGFAYLPGSGLKGMARAYAETVWLPTQPDPRQAWRQIEDVFGWAPNPDRLRQIGDPDHPAAARRENEGDPKSPDIRASSGIIVFHDAWPTEWPQLIVDIVNNHHAEYYQHDDNEHAPGDWENPVPVYFLAVKPGTTFTFALSKRRADVPDELLALARQWLLGALCYLGAGAKTNAGYGAFKPVNGTEDTWAKVNETWQSAISKPPDSPRRAVFETTLELVTPAFLAGADQYGPAAADGCDLRPATLRGQLRWWWRTMHAGFLDVKTLRALEATIWGDTHAAGAVRIVIERRNAHGPLAYDKRNKANFSDQEKRSQYGIPNEDPRKTTQGLWYASYGMDEGRGDARRQRHVLEPPASWQLRLIARPTRFLANRAHAAEPSKYNQGKAVAADQVLRQAQAALWLLCHFGGIGSKARKGFGSLAAGGLDGWNQNRCGEGARKLRDALGLPDRFDPRQAHSSSLNQMLGPVEVQFPWPDVWQVLDQVGFAYQAFAKKYKHQREKMALGLPRRIGSPAQGRFDPTPPVTADGRHSSPVHVHVERNNGRWLVRAVAFSAAHLPDLKTSTQFLNEFLQDFKGGLQRRASLSPPPSRPRRAAGVQAQATVVPGPKPGDRVEAVLLAEKTKKGGWKAQHEPTGLCGPIHNSADVPADKKPGDRLTLIVASANPREIAFRYPAGQDDKRTGNAPRSPQGTPGGSRGDRPRKSG